MSAILFDLDGVLYEGDRPIDGAAETIDWFNKNHIPHLFLTNTTSKSRSELVEKLSAFGIETRIKDYPDATRCCQTMVTGKYTKSNRPVRPRINQRRVFRFRTGYAMKTAMSMRSWSVTWESRWTFKMMNQVFRTMINSPDARLVALGMTRYWRADSGLQLDVGPMIKAFEYATGKQAVVTGKPAKTFFEAAVNILGADGNIMMIGDDIRGDIEASQQAGLKAIQVRTGKFSTSDLDLGITPDVILDSVADLPAWWQSSM